ncbi:spermidine synthase [Planomonospora corallina]|uniref:Spermidine synthase n=1 Tax=Planomonospora corallina TaxID=1806052 RepID=A0ABV8IAM6_9ACTN
MTAAAQSTPSRPPGTRPAHSLATRPRLVVASAFMLFLELALIRWTGSNIVHLSYFTNFVLLGSFLGIGLGFLRVGRTDRAPYYSPITLAALVLVVLVFPVTVDRQTEGVLYWTSLSAGGPPPWLILPVVFVAAAVVLMGPAELVGRCFPELDRLEAYRYDLIGSLTGIGLFTALSFLGAPPVAWGVVAALAYAVLLWPRSLRGRLALAVPALLVVGALGVETLTAGALWSPYYKVTHHRFEHQGVPVTDIQVNGIPHQQAIPAAKRLEWERQYALPYERAAAGRLDDVLIVGAGSGTDVAIALARGARRVDAVEIDPRLRELGAAHPDRPYDDPRVTAHITDGRAFLERTGAKYDLILFALPDSLTLVSGASSLRLESYLFTREAIEAARERLKPGGAFSMYNYYRESWLVDRLASTVQAAFGHRPCVDVVSRAGQQAVITAGLTAADQSCGEPWAGAAAGTPPPPADDLPFLYLKERTVPGIYVVTLALILAVSLLAVRALAGPYGRMRPYADLFLLGVAFLLLETRSVTGFALLFGTTWVVNAIVFAGVLVAVLAAVEVTRRLRTPSLPVMYGVLLAGLALAWLVPDSWLLSLPVPLRAAAAVVVAFLPIFAANVVFAKRFADSADATTAFGANLLGAMAGGCLEYLALVIGYRGLLVVAAVLYLGAFALLPRSARAA